MVALGASQLVFAEHENGAAHAKATVKLVKEVHTGQPLADNEEVDVTKNAPPVDTSAVVEKNGKAETK